jgi:hypothetical protein
MRFVAIGFRGHIGVEDVYLFLHGPQVRPHLPISIRIVLGGIPPPQRGFRNSLGVCCDVGEHPFGESRFCHSTEQARKTLFTIWVRALAKLHSLVKQDSISTAFLHYIWLRRGLLRTLEVDLVLDPCNSAEASSKMTIREK